MGICVDEDTDGEDQRSHKDTEHLKKRFHGEMENPKGIMKQWV